MRLAPTRRVVRGGWGRADYNEWGQITYSAALSITSSYRRIWPQLSYTGHDWDDVLGMYYAKARFYSADDKRFVAMDPIKGNITNPLSLVSYVYCVDNPLRWVDPLGLIAAYIDRQAVEVKYIDRKLSISLEDALTVYGFRPGTNPNTYISDRGIVLTVSSNNSKISGLSLSKREYRTPGTTKRNFRFSYMLPSIFDYTERTLALKTSEGKSYVGLEYFLKFMCELGDNRSVKYTDWMMSPQEIGNAITNYQLTNSQANTLLTANEYYLNNPELKDTTSVFAFEGAGNVNSAWGDYHPYGQFNAMIVSIDSEGNVIALTKNGSTLPDKPQDKRAVTKEGIYSLTSASHNGYAAATLNKKGNVDAYRDKEDSTASAINFHAAGSSRTTNNNWSAGCIVISLDDYINFGVQTGFLKEESLDFTYTGFTGFKNSFNYSTYTNPFSGKIVIDRSELYNLLIRDGKGDAEVLEYYFGKDWYERR